MATPVPSKAPPASNGAAKPSPPKAATASRLASLQATRLKIGLRYLFYGPQGIGKTNLAADADALFIDADGGSGNYLVKRYPFNPGEIDEHKPRTYEQVTAALDEMALFPQHLPGAIAIDTINRIEELLQDYVTRSNKEKSIEDVGGGFQKGYKVAIEELNRFLAKLERLQYMGVTIILLGHSTTTTFKNPRGDDYEYFNLACNATRNGDFAGRVKQWCDVVGFLHFNSGARKLDPKDKRARGWQTGERLCELADDAAWNAKSRLALPATVEISEERPWLTFANAKVLGTREQLLEAIDAEHDRITNGARDVEFTTASGKATDYERIQKLVADANENTLTRILGGLRATPTI